MDLPNIGGETMIGRQCSRVPYTILPDCNKRKNLICGVPVHLCGNCWRAHHERDKKKESSGMP